MCSGMWSCTSTLSTQVYMSVIWSEQETNPVSGQRALTAQTHRSLQGISSQAVMTAVLDPFEPFSSELHVIRRLNSSLHQDGRRDRPKTGHVGSLRLQPPAERVTLAPLRDDVPLLDPCCGQLSAGAEVVLGLKGRKKFIDFDHVPSALWVPPGFRERPQTTPNFSVVCVDLSEDKAWNSKRIPHAALRARLSGKKQTNRSIF